MSFEYLSPDRVSRTFAVHECVSLSELAIAIAKIAYPRGERLVWKAEGDKVTGCCRYIHVIGTHGAVEIFQKSVGSFFKAMP